MEIKEINELLCTNYESKEEFLNRVDWEYISYYRTLSEGFIREFQDKVDWRWISRCQVLSEDFIKEFQDRVDWYGIFNNQELSEEFREKFKNRLKEDDMNKEMEIEIPKGYEFDRVEDGKIKLKEVKKELPKTIKDCINLLRKQDKNCYWVSVTSGSINESRYNYNVGDLPSKKIAISIRALQKLLVAREVYRDGWEPDWTDGAHKYIIYMNGSCLYKSSSISTTRVLAFQTYEIRDLFYDNFEGLIEEAKELL